MYLTVVVACGRHESFALDLPSEKQRDPLLKIQRGGPVDEARLFDGDEHLVAQKCRIDCEDSVGCGVGGYLKRLVAGD